MATSGLATTTDDLDNKREKLERWLVWVWIQKGSELCVVESRKYTGERQKVPGKHNKQASEQVLLSFAWKHATVEVRACC